MKIECFCYYSVVKKKGFYSKGNKKYVGIAGIRKQLPEHVSKEILPGTVSQESNSICVETKKKDIVSYLDKVMKIKKNNFCKRLRIEITKDEIDNYDFFYVGLRDLDWRKQIEYDVSRPTCPYDSCPVGSVRTSPTRINSRRIRSINISEIYDIWEMGKRFVVSEKLKNIFVEHKVTGLNYEPCIIEHSRDKKSEAVIFHNRFYVGEITSAAAHYASDLYLHSYCKQHKVIISYHICNIVNLRDSLLQDDFQMINRVIVKGIVYYYSLPFWFVSRKVLKILLEHAKQDLRVRTIFFKEPFRPVPITEVPLNESDPKISIDQIFAR